MLKAFMYKEPASPGFLSVKASGELALFLPKRTDRWEAEWQGFGSMGAVSWAGRAALQSPSGPGKGV